MLWGFPQTDHSVAIKIVTTGHSIFKTQASVKGIANSIDDSSFSHISGTIRIDNHATIHSSYDILHFGFLSRIVEINDFCHIGVVTKICFFQDTFLKTLKYPVVIQSFLNPEIGFCLVSIGQQLLAPRELHLQPI